MKHIIHNGGMLIAPGEYTVMVTHSYINSANNLTSVLTLELTVVEGSHANMQMSDDIVMCDGGITVRIGQEKLAAYCKALGIEELSDPSGLHHKHFIADIDVNIKNNINILKSCRAVVAQQTSNYVFDLSEQEVKPAEVSTRSISDITRSMCR